MSPPAEPKVYQLTYAKLDTEATKYLQVIPRLVDWDNYVYVNTKGETMELGAEVNGTLTKYDENTDAGSDQYEWFNVWVRCDGSDVSA